MESSCCQGPCRISVISVAILFACITLILSSVLIFSCLVCSQLLCLRGHGYVDDAGDADDVDVSCLFARC